MKTQRWAEELWSVIILKWPSYSTVNARPLAHPPTLSLTLSRSFVSHCVRGLDVNPRIHSLSKTANRASTATSQDQYNDTQGKPTKTVKAGGHSQQNKWEIKKQQQKKHSSKGIAMFSCHCICDRFSHWMRLFIFIFHDESWDGMTESRSLAANWKTSASCQQRSTRTWCLGFLFISCVGFHCCIRSYI